MGFEVIVQPKNTLIKTAKTVFGLTSKYNPFQLNHFGQRSSLKRL